MIAKRHLFEWALLVVAIVVIGGSLIAESGRIRQSHDEVQRELAYYRLQAAIELYADQHLGNRPESLDRLLVRTDAQGEETPAARFGPYLNELPAESFGYNPQAGVDSYRPQS